MIVVRGARGAERRCTKVHTQLCCARMWTYAGRKKRKR